MRNPNYYYNKMKMLEHESLCSPMQIQCTDCGKICNGRKEQVDYKEKHFFFWFKILNIKILNIKILNIKILNIRTLNIKSLNIKSLNIISSNIRV